MAVIGSVWAPHTWNDDAWADHTWADSSTPTVVTVPPSPHRLAFDLTTTLLDWVDVVPTQLAFAAVSTGLAFLDANGVSMSTPLIFTAGETGPITVSCTGADGTPENLATASAVVFTMQNRVTGVVKVSAVALTSGASDGTATWTRLAAQVDTAGDYLGQVKVTRADGTIGYYPDASGSGQVSGSAITILKALG